LISSRYINGQPDQARLFDGEKSQKGFMARLLHADANRLYHATPGLPTMTNAWQEIKHTDDSDMREKIQHLANLAYERELQRELSRVQRHIDMYREKESKFFQLSDLKFKFYRETSDELWRLYDRLEPEKAIERAVALGLLTNDEVPEDLRNALQQPV
jgi:hypothetical protein